MMGMKVHLVGIGVALAFSVLGAFFVLISGYGELVFLIILLWILVPVLISKLYYRLKG